MNNSSKKDNIRIRIVSKNYYLEKVLINGDSYYFHKDNSEYIVSAKEEENIDMYFVPRYLEKHSIFKMILFFVENLFSGGSGKSKKELKKEMIGFHVFGKLKDVNSVIHIDKNQYCGLQCKEYTSKKLNVIFYLFYHIPMIIFVFVVFVFFIWALCKLL